MGVSRRLVLGVALGLLTGCGGDTEPDQAKSTLRQVSGVTWVHLGVQFGAAFTIGPLLESDVGPLRSWCLFVHVPGGEEPLSCIPGLVPPWDSSPIGVGGENFEIELRPRDALLWGDVEHESQLDVRVTGLH